MHGSVHGCMVVGGGGGNGALDYLGLGGGDGLVLVGPDHWGSPGLVLGIN